ncbi:MviN protein [Vibrio cholerae]|nr:MviN protein [Vibrio cholerae]
MAELGNQSARIDATGLIGLGVASYLAILLLLGVRLKDLKAATE